MQTEAIREQLEAMAMQLDALSRQLGACIAMMPCTHPEVELVPGSTMGNAQYCCTRCGEVVEQDG